MTDRQPTDPRRRAECGMTEHCHGWAAIDKYAVRALGYRTPQEAHDEYLNMQAAA